MREENTSNVNQETVDVILRKAKRGDYIDVLGFALYEINCCPNDTGLETLKAALEAIMKYSVKQAKDT